MSLITEKEIMTITVYGVHNENFTINNQISVTLKPEGYNTVPIQVKSMDNLYYAGTFNGNKVYLIKMSATKITYQMVADKLNEENGNNNWSADDVECWDTGSNLENYSSVSEMVNDIRQSGKDVGDFE